MAGGRNRGKNAASMVLTRPAVASRAKMRPIAIRRSDEDFTAGRMFGQRSPTFPQVGSKEAKRRWLALFR